MSNWFTRIFSQKESQARTLVAFLNLNRPVSTPADYKGFSEEGFKKNAIVYACISLIARNAGGIDWVLYRKRRGMRDLSEIEEHELLKLLSRPNPLQAGSSFIEAVMGYYKIAGNSFIEGVRPGERGTFTELWPLRPDRMKVIAGERGLPEGYEFTVTQNSKHIFQVDQITGKSPVLHLKSFNPTNDWYGQSGIEPSAADVDQHNAAGSWNLAMLQNQAKPSGALVATVSESNPSGSISDEQYERLKEMLNSNHAGPKNAGRMMLLEGGLDWKQMQLTQSDMDWLNGRHASARNIALTLGVPPQLLGIPGDNTYSNYQEARLALYEETIIPDMDMLRSELNRWLVPEFGDDLYIDYDRDNIEALEPKRKAVWDKVQTSQFLTINEKRQAVGYEPIDGGDTVFVSAADVPLSFANEIPEIPPADDDAKQSASEHESKIFNLRSEREKLLEWRRTEKFRRGFEKRLTKQLDALFEIEANEVAKVVEGLPLEAAKLAAAKEIQDNEDNLRKILESSMIQAGQFAGGRVLRSLKNYTPEVETKNIEVRFTQFLKEFVKQSLARKIKLISKTTEKEIRQIIENHIALGAIEDDQGTPQGEGQQSLAQKIREKYKQMSIGRANTIARTEVGSAFSNASLGAAKATNIPNLKKEWISVSDDRARDDHKYNVKNRIVDIDEKFNVDGDMMDGPNDQAAPAAQIINCRCTLSYLGEND